MNQLALKVSLPVPYQGSDFLVHAGVKEIWDCVFSSISSGKFSSFFIVGEQKTGKTHLGLSLEGAVAETVKGGREGVRAFFVNGSDFDGWMNDYLRTSAYNKRDIVIVDDADSYFLPLKPGQSGPFVNLVERLKTQKGTLVMLSSRDFHEFNVDGHIMSRLNSCLSFIIGAPAPEELPPLIDKIGKQRGLKIAETRVGYLTKRLSTRIPDIVTFMNTVVTEAWSRPGPVNLKIKQLSEDAQESGQTVNILV